MTVLEEAQKYVNGDRADDYGPVHESWGQIADMWSVILRKQLKGKITAKQACLCMAGLKICRETYQEKRDNAVDGAGYFELVGRLQT